ncbi:MAG: GatB/YqeY domain-containing protein [Candidatus Eisenbacteria bacterium]|nr:GatB/YqeY domain-containing protein [Candidatus Eisenbacteria bacterium]
MSANDDATIQARLQTDLVRAMKDRDAETLSTLRMLKAALMEAKTAKPREATLSAEEEIEILQRYVKKRRETIEINARHGRADLNAAEEREIAVTQRYLPAALSEDALAEIVGKAVASTGAAGPKDMGKVIGAVMAQVKGRAEGSAVSRLVKQALGG